MKTRALLLSAALLAISPPALVGCPPSGGDDDDATAGRSFDDLCPINCTQQEQCYGLQNQTMQECVDQCITWRTDDLDRMGDVCDELLFDLRECEYALSCADWDVFLEGTWNDGEPCAAEAQRFHIEEDCMAGSNR